jgi:hypothetical protein
MKKLIIILTIDFIVAGFVLFLVFQPTPQTAEQGNGIIRDYIYSEVSNSNNKAEQVSLPGVLVAAKEPHNVIADVVKPKHNVNYKTKHSKPKNYKFLSKNRLPVTWYNAIIRHPSNDPDPLKLNVNNASYINKSANLSKVSANY